MQENIINTLPSDLIPVSENPISQSVQVHIDGIGVVASPIFSGQFCFVSVSNFTTLLFDPRGSFFLNFNGKNS